MTVPFRILKMPCAQDSGPRAVSRQKAHGIAFWRPDSVLKQPFSHTARSIPFSPVLFFSKHLLDFQISLIKLVSAEFYQFLGLF